MTGAAVLLKEKSPERMAKTQGAEIRFVEVHKTGVFIAKAAANHSDSMRLLQENGLWPMPAKAPLFIYRNEELKKALIELWYYIGGDGLYSAEALYARFDRDGRFRKGRSTDPEKTICLRDGKNPLSLIVLSDDLAILNRGRFVLSADTDPQYIAPVVVGVKIDSMLPDRLGMERFVRTRGIREQAELLRQLKSARRKAE